MMEFKTLDMDEVAEFVHDRFQKRTMHGKSELSLYFDILVE